MFGFGPRVFGPDGIEFKMPIYIWHHWPLKTSHDNGLLFLRNSFFHKFFNTSWHSIRHYPQFTSTRYQVLQAVCENDLPKLERCLRHGKWNIDDTVDHAGRFTAVGLACHLDRLEVLHFLDLYGADLSSSAGKY